MYQRGEDTHSNGYSSDGGSMGSTDGEGPTYLVEHLATFSVSSQSNIMHPADGMRQLLHMEKTSGIWTQKMKLRLHNQAVVILDHENGDVVEKFPMPLIRDPTAFTSTDPKEMYNNIFIFIVTEDPSGRSGNPTEMHIFQCVRVSAQDVVEDLKLFLEGKGSKADPHIPPPPTNPPPEPPLNGMSVREQVSIFNASADSTRKYSQESDMKVMEEDGSSVGSERYERDVAILNSCFDDIEKFIARLQSAATAQKELDRRRRSRKSKKREPGDGMLSVRAKPPPEHEFIDIFQKFKLSFNLLAKLRCHIHDPNAPELVHFLFTPLALLVDAVWDANPGAPPVPSKVVSPLLTREGIDLLKNCLTSKESDLWYSLGDAWTIPKEQWKDYVPPYQPVFMNGWSPEYHDPPADDSPPPSPSHYESKEELARRIHRSISPPGRSDISVDSIEGRGGSPWERRQQQWLAELQTRGAKIVQVTYPRTANNDKELTVVRGEFLEVVDDNRKWWKARNAMGVVAHVPHTIVTPFQPGMLPLPPTPSDPHPDVFSNPVYGRSQDTGSESNLTPAPPEWIQSNHKEPENEDEDGLPMPENRRSKDNRKSPLIQQLLAEEFKDKMESLKKKSDRPTPAIQVHKTPEVFVNDRSTPQDVQEWLNKKNFPQSVRIALEGTSGKELLKLPSEHCVKVFGEKEGKKLASQIKLQRETSGYNTVSGKELMAILARRREQSETKAIEPPKILDSDSDTS